MRRVVTILILVTVALGLAACGAATPTTDTTGTAGAPVAGVPVAPTPAANNALATDDVFSPTQTVTPGEMFTTDSTMVPANVLTLLKAKKPLLVLWYDPSTEVAADQRREVNATMKKYRGTISLVALNYTVGLTSSETSTTLDAETQKIELLATALKVNTTPYILFVDRYGRITYRFAGYTDRALLNREVLRATQ